jgi:hypothetical protein
MENGPCVQFYFQTRLKMETEFFQTCWCWWGNSPPGEKTFEKSARGRENNKNLKIKKRRTGKFEIPTTTRNLVGRANSKPK